MANLNNFVRRPSVDPIYRDQCKNISERYHYLNVAKKNDNCAQAFIYQKIKHLQRNCVKNLSSAYFIKKSLVPLLTYELRKTHDIANFEKGKHPLECNIGLSDMCAGDIGTEKNEECHQRSSYHQNSPLEYRTSANGIVLLDDNEIDLGNDIVQSVQEEATCFPTLILMGNTFKSLSQQCEEMHYILTGNKVRRPIIYREPISAFFNILKENGLRIKDMHYLRKKIFPLAETSTSTGEDLNGIKFVSGGYLSSHIRSEKDYCVVRPKFVLDFYKCKVSSFTFTDYDKAHCHGNVVYNNFSDFFVGCFSICIACQVSTKRLNVTDFDNLKPQAFISKYICESIKWYLNHFFEEARKRKNEYFLAYENDYEYRENVSEQLANDFFGMQNITGTESPVFIRHLAGYPKAYTRKNAFRFVMDTLLLSKSNKGQLLVNDIISVSKSELIRNFFFELANYSYMERLGAMGSSIICACFCVLGEDQFNASMPEYLMHMSDIELLHGNSASVLPGLFDIFLMFKGKGHREMVLSLKPIMQGSNEDFIQSYHHILGETMVPNALSCFITTMNCISTERQLLTNTYKNNNEEKLQRIAFSKKLSSEALFQLIEQSINRIFHKTVSPIAVKAKLRNRENLYCRELSSLIISGNAKDRDLARFVVNGFLYDYRFDEFIGRN